MEQIEYKTDNATYMIEGAEGNYSATVIVGGDCIGEIRYCGGIFIGSAMDEKYVEELCWVCVQKTSVGEKGIEI